MKSIADYDKNFAESRVKTDGKTAIYDITAEPFSLHGIKKVEKGFIRMDESVARSSNEGVAAFNYCVAGGRLRFVTDSPAVTLYVDGPEYEKDGGCMCANGKAGFSLYEGSDTGERLIHVFTASRESTFEFDKKGVRELTLYFPIYYAPYDIKIGLCEGASLRKAKPYKTETPVFFYGSSITQGAVVSHPGNTYISILSRRYRFDYVNLGFSGSCKGEPSIAEYIKKQKMSAFVLDYDHNAPSVEHLEKTHYPFYKTVREANPDLPIIMMTMPYGYGVMKGWANDHTRVIEESYRRGISEGDKNLYYVNQNNSYDRFGGQDATADLVHPNDLGMACMADAMIPVFDKIFK